MKRLIKNIACLAGIDSDRKHCLRGSEMATLNCIQDAWLLVDGDRFDSWGEMANMPAPEADWEASSSAWARKSPPACATAS